MKEAKLKLPIYLPWSAPLLRRARPWWPMGGSLKNCSQGARSCSGERAPPQESAPQLRKARPSSRGRALVNCKGLFQKFAHRGRAPVQESAPLLRRACPFSWGHALLAQGAHQEINQAKIRHSFALKMNVGAGTQFVHNIVWLFCSLKHFIHKLSLQQFV